MALYRYDRCSGMIRGRVYVLSEWKSIKKSVCACLIELRDRLSGLSGRDWVTHSCGWAWLGTGPLSWAWLGPELPSRRWLGFGSFRWAYKGPGPPNWAWLGTGTPGRGRARSLKGCTQPPCALAGLPPSELVACVQNIWRENVNKD